MPLVSRVGLSIEEVLHPMMELLPVILFGLSFVAVVVMVVIRMRASRPARLERLAELGFSAAPEAKQALVEKITWLENNAGYHYSVEQPARASLSGKEVHFYQKSRHRTGSIYAAEEMLLPLSRPSEAGLMLFVKPSGIPAGTATKLVGCMPGAMASNVMTVLLRGDLILSVTMTSVATLLWPLLIALCVVTAAAALPLLRRSPAP